MDDSGLWALCDSRRAAVLALLFQPLGSAFQADIASWRVLSGVVARRVETAAGPREIFCAWAGCERPGIVVEFLFPLVRRFATSISTFCSSSDSTMSEEHEKNAQTQRAVALA
jgi:hypothetical protein